jgi:hypothetical protein
MITGVKTYRRLKASCLEGSCLEGSRLEDPAVRSSHVYSRMGRSVSPGMAPMQPVQTALRRPDPAVPVWSLLLLLSLLAGPLPAADQAPPNASWSIEQLMQTLAAVDRAAGMFTEEKTLAMLEAPLILTGTLHYVAPDYLKKLVLSPHEESYELRGEHLTVDDPAHGRRVIILDSYPLLKAFVAAVRATLAGDLESLQKYYRLSLKGQRENWTLQLTPLHEDMARYVMIIIMRGEREQVQSIETLEADGDRSLMRISPVDL